ncbi:ArsR family transcriptional regulator [Brachybacterium ginsengisoli]|uniref:ArsR family transcriptional regulator n=1 Tax=Brachybacterium ginsengisoli TaxID=1331682 RepID=A0A291GYY3_9MICO|nr:metalloregulator ArsR/SmtB family transcription factor [Brachybacterium ginsengisoli]ATG55417.1 ArsR family transcriptional regulator [Brachybacterium ginsengisoli]
MNSSSDDVPGCLVGLSGAADRPGDSPQDRAVPLQEDELEELRERLPAPEETADLADVFSLLGDPSRLGLLIALRDAELCVSDLAQATDHSESSVSHALKLLRAHRIVAVRRVGRRAFYRLDDPHVRLLLELAMTHTAHSDMQHPERDRAQGAAS